MKKVIAFLLIGALMLSALGCAPQGSPETKVSFTAAVLEIGEGSLTVRPAEGSDELNSADMISVPIEHMDSSTEPVVGDIVEIVYNGDIMETYPAQLGKVYSISVKERAAEAAEEASMPLGTRKPPVLTVSYGEDSVEAMRGTYNWTAKEEDGSDFGICVDAIHPLQAQKQTPMLILAAASGQAVAYLKFEYAPDELSVRCWPAECWGMPDADGEEAELYYDTDSAAPTGIVLKDGDYIYEVSAVWDDSDGVGGRAWYSFFAKDARESADPAELFGISLAAKDVTSAGLTLLISQSGGAIPGELQYGSDYKLQVNKNGAWEDVPYIVENAAWTMEAYTLPIGSEAEQAINWENIYGELEAGQEYRVLKRFTVSRGPGDYDSAEVTAEFTIG